MPTDIPNGLSYEYQNLVRNVMETFIQLVKSQPTFLSLIPVGAPALAKKEEWPEDEIEPVETAVVDFDSDGDGTGVNVTSTAGMRAGTILRFTTAADVSETEQCRVVSVDSATDLTLERDYAGTAGITLVATDKVFVVSSPRNESTEAGNDGGQEPLLAHNFTEIFDRTAKISKTAQTIKIYGLEDALQYQVANKLMDIAYEMNTSAIHGTKLARSAATEGTSGGILSFMVGGNIETTGGAISAVILNNMLEAIFLDGATSNNYALLCPENQARAISGFNSAGDNPIISVPQSPEQFTGHYISRFVGDLPVAKGFTAPIIVDPNMPKDQVAIVDMNRVEWAWLRSLEDEDATPKGADFFARRILGEVTLRIKNGTQAHAKAVGLDV